MADIRGVLTFAQLPTTVRIAQAVGITASAFLSGTLAIQSYGLLPASTTPPHIITAHWRDLFYTGAKTSLPLALLSALSFAYLANHTLNAPLAPHGTELDPRRTAGLYAVAAALAPAIVPYTLTVMKKVNDRLHNKTVVYGSRDLEKGEVQRDAEVEELAGRWARLNAGRAVLPALSAVLGAWAVVSRPEVVGLAVL